MDPCLNCGKNTDVVLDYCRECRKQLEIVTCHGCKKSKKKEEIHGYYNRCKECIGKVIELYKKPKCPHCNQIIDHVGYCEECKERGETVECNFCRKWKEIEEMDDVEPSYCKECAKLGFEICFVCGRKHINDTENPNRRFGEEYSFELTKEDVEQLRTINNPFDKFIKDNILTIFICGYTSRIAQTDGCFHLLANYEAEYTSERIIPIHEEEITIEKIVKRILWLQQLSEIYPLGA
ncbi:MAG: hypothetical protein ACTSQF_13305 [Candidatus Heimdallarchaeaceae archaeon]